MNKDYLSLYLVLEPQLCGGLKQTLETVKLATDAGVTAIQLRFEEETDKGEWYQYAKSLKSLLKNKNIPLIINNHIDIALAVDADGVHIGQKDLPIHVVRKLIGKQKIIGLSINNEKELFSIPKNSVDYLGIGPIFPTLTKKNIQAIIGINQLKNLINQTKIPSVAIGGINKGNVTEIILTGVKGVAVISAICGQKDTFFTTKELIKIIKENKYD